MTGQELKSLREQIGLTQTELAHKLGVDQGTISRWERMRRVPRPWRVRAWLEKTDSQKSKG